MSERPGPPPEFRSSNPEARAAEPETPGVLDKALDDLTEEFLRPTARAPQPPRAPDVVDKALDEMTTEIFNPHTRKPEDDSGAPRAVEGPTHPSDA